MAALSQFDVDDQVNVNPGTVNSVKTDAALLKVIENLKKQVNALRSKLNQPGNGWTNTDSAPPTINPKTGKAFKRYCWTCGCCDHCSSNHPGVKAPGHDNSATFKDRKGGSNKNCLGPKP